MFVAYVLCCHSYSIVSLNCISSDFTHCAFILNVYWTYRCPELGYFLLSFLLIVKYHSSMLGEVK